MAKKKERRARCVVCNGLYGVSTQLYREPGSSQWDKRFICIECVVKRYEDDRLAKAESTLDEAEAVI